MRCAKNYYFFFSRLFLNAGLYFYSPVFFWRQQKNFYYFFRAQPFGKKTYTHTRTDSKQSAKRNFILRLNFAGSHLHHSHVAIILAVTEGPVREEQLLHDMCLLGAVTVEITQILTRAGFTLT